MSRTWTWSDYDTLRKEYPLSGVNIVERFPDVPMATIQTRALRVDAVTTRPFSVEEQRLAKDYADVLGAALIFLMPERTPNEVALLLG